MSALAIIACPQSMPSFATSASTIHRWRSIVSACWRCPPSVTNTVLWSSSPPKKRRPRSPAGRSFREWLSREKSAGLLQRIELERLGDMNNRVKHKREPALTMSIWARALTSDAWAKAASSDAPLCALTSRLSLANGCRSNPESQRRPSFQPPAGTASAPMPSSDSSLAI